MRYTPEQRGVLRAAADIKRAARKTAKAARPKRPKADRGRERDPGFLAFLRRQPCAVGPIGCGGAVEAAHVRFATPGAGPTGMQRKPDDKRAVPLCAMHHREGPLAQHRYNERRWWEAHRIDPLALANRLHEAYRNG
jgi:hypothetical protein